jgi:hypothetical protein
MLNMQTFYKLLSPKSKGTDAYFKTMHLLTRTSRTQMQALESDLSWQDWAEQNKKS